MNRPLMMCVSALVLTSACGRSRSAHQQRRSSALPDSVRSALIEMGKEDQAARTGLTPEKMRDSVFLTTLRQGDSARTQHLHRIVDRYGWPTDSSAGPEGADAAFLVLQHSPDHGFQQAMLPQLEAMAREGAVRPSDVALLVDRVLVQEGKPQRYGTQFSMVNGQLVMDSVEDRDSLDARRRSMQLPPMAEYERVLENMYRAHVSGAPDTDTTGDTLSGRSRGE